MRTNDEQQQIYKQLLADAERISSETGKNITINYSTNGDIARNVNVSITVPENK